MKILVTAKQSDISNRFDLTMEVVIATTENNHLVKPFRTILLPRPSAEDLCSLIMKENIDLVICGAVEEKHLKYLSWKKIKIVDSVIGPYSEAIDLAIPNKLKPGTILPGARKN